MVPSQRVRVRVLEYKREGRTRPVPIIQSYHTMSSPTSPRLGVQHSRSNSPNIWYAQPLLTMGEIIPRFDRTLKIQGYPKAPEVRRQGFWFVETPDSVSRSRKMRLMGRRLGITPPGSTSPMKIWFGQQPSENTSTR